MSENPIPADAQTTVEPSDVYWWMDWSQRKPTGERAYPDKPERELVFEQEDALALLLINEVVFLNSHHWEDDWPVEARKAISINVNCNDVFVWGCADAETLPYGEIQALYDMWAKDPREGGNVWCIIRRKQLPQRPVAEAIRKAGIWDLGAMAAEHGLLPNHYDGISNVLARRKYDTYCAWETANSREPRPFDKHWWAGWREYTDAHPDWLSAEWKAEDDRRCDEWRIANGYAARDALAKATTP